MKYNSRNKNIAANANTEIPKMNWTVVLYVSPPGYTGYNGGDDSTIFILELIPIEHAANWKVLHLGKQGNIYYITEQEKSS